MQTVLNYLVLLLVSFTLQAQNTVKVTVKGFESNEGKALIALFNSESTFLNKNYKGEKVTIENQEAFIEFTNIPDGEYAISMFHDKNNNGELDIFMGFYPKEPYGCSNNAIGRFGPPKWEDAVFSLSGNQTKEIEINL